MRDCNLQQPAPRRVAGTLQRGGPARASDRPGIVPCDQICDRPEQHDNVRTTAATSKPAQRMMGRQGTDLHLTARQYGSARPDAAGSARNAAYAVAAYLA